MAAAQGWLPHSAPGPWTGCLVGEVDAKEMELVARWVLLQPDSSPRHERGARVVAGDEEQVVTSSSRPVKRRLGRGKEIFLGLSRANSMTRRTRSLFPPLMMVMTGTMSAVLGGFSMAFDVGASCRRRGGNCCVADTLQLQVPYVEALRWRRQSGSSGISLPLVATPAAIFSRRGRHREMSEEWARRPEN